MDSGPEPSQASTGGLRQRGPTVAPEGQDGAVREEAEAKANMTLQQRGRHDHYPRMSARCRRILSSTPFKIFTLSVVSVPPVFGVLAALPHLLDLCGCTGSLCRLGHYIFATWVSIQFLYNFASTQHTDAGGCRLVKPMYEASGQFGMYIDEVSDPDSGKREPILYAPNFCELCQQWKPPRSHHCSFCGRCVLRMDHHCPFTGNCIGMRNHGHFVLMYIFAFIGLGYSLVMCTCTLFKTPNPNLLEGENGVMMRKSQFVTGFSGMVATVLLRVFLAAGLQVAVQTALTVIASIAVLGFGGPAMYIAFTGATMLEQQFPMKEYVQIKPQVYCPLGPGFYRWRWYENLRVLLGARWYLRILLPTPGGPVDLQPAIAPRPSKEGVAALRQRFTQVEMEGVQREVKSVQELGINPGPAASGTPV